MELFARADRSAWLDCQGFSIAYQSRQPSKICFLYCLHRKEQVATEKSTEVIKEMMAIARRVLSPNMTVKMTPYIKLKTAK
jgi:hypothetical protein